MKLPLIVAAITASRADWEAIEAAITRSDNDAAALLWDRLDDGAAEVEAVLRLGGDDETTLERERDPRGYSSAGRTVCRCRRAYFLCSPRTRRVAAGGRHDTSARRDGKDHPGAALGLGRVPGI